MASLLISRNTDPNIANKVAYIREEMLCSSASFIIKIQEGETALMASARRDGTSLTNSLLDHGADPNAVDQVLISLLRRSFFYL